MMNLRALISVMSKALVAVLIFLLGTELCARLDDLISYGAPFLGEYSYSCLQSKDSAGFPFNVPNARFEKWENNSFGFRGPEVTKDKPNGMLRVVIVGTSESYGLYESPDKEWPSQLRATMSASKWEIMNASVVGLNLSSCETYIKKHVLPVRPDIIILFMNPLLYMTSEERAATENSPLRSVGANSEKQEVPFTVMLSKNIRSMEKIKQVCKGILLYNCPDVFKRYQIWSLNKQLKEIECLRLKGQEERVRETVPAAYVDSFHKQLTGLVRWIRSQGIEVMLSSSPALICKENVSQYPEIFLDNRRFFVEFSLSGMIDAFVKGNRVIANVAEEGKTMFVDSAAIVPKSTEYFSDNVHFTDKGARVVAEGVASILRRNEPALLARGQP